MKITDVKVTLFKWEDIPTTNYSPLSGKIGGESDMGLVTIETDEGVVGHAFLGSSSQPGSLDAPHLIKYIKPVLIGQNPLERERLWQHMMFTVRKAGIRPIGACDIALWDIGGKVANMPLHQMMGTYRTSVRAYASSTVYQQPEVYAEEAAKMKEEGWTAYKIHPPTNPELDIECCRQIREAVGDDHTLMLDSTWAYDYPSAVRVGRAIQDFDYYWYEDPLADDDIYNYTKLRQQLHIPVMATEYSPGNFTAYGPWLTSQATDYLRGDVAIKGGITAILKTAHLAEAFHMNYEVHHGGNSLNNVANLHVIMAIKNCEFFEVLLPSGAQKYGLAEEIEIDSEGNVHAFMDPGLGAKIDFDLIERMKITTQS
jgi:L-alanine-DL-glutamate epimerase-like enolase superfamily enzyme